MLRADLLTAGTVLTRGPALVHALLLAGDGAAADAQIYDGQNNTGRLVSHLEAGSGGSTPFAPPHPFPVLNGLFVTVNATTSKLTVLWEPIDRKTLTDTLKEPTQPPPPAQPAA